MQNLIRLSKGIGRIEFSPKRKYRPRGFLFSPNAEYYLESHRIDSRQFKSPLFFAPVRFPIFFCAFQMVTRTKKIFVGGLSAPTTLEDVKSYFEQFGPVSTSLFAFPSTPPFYLPIILIPGPQVPSQTSTISDFRRGVRETAPMAAIVINLEFKIKLIVALVGAS